MTEDIDKIPIFYKIIHENKTSDIHWEKILDILNSKYFLKRIAKQMISCHPNLSLQDFKRIRLEPLTNPYNASIEQFSVNFYLVYDYYLRLKIKTRDMCYNKCIVKLKNIILNKSIKDFNSKIEQKTIRYSDISETQYIIYLTGIYG